MFNKIGLWKRYDLYWLTEALAMELALGTAQFGLAYGVAGRNAPVPENEVRDILARASSLGIHVLDTAADYGQIESRIVDLAVDRVFKIVTKLSTMPKGMNPKEAENWVGSALQQAGERLGNSLYAVLFHRAEDLLEYGGAAWEECMRWGSDRGIKFGVSCYDPVTLSRVCEQFPITISQLPVNAFDQRLRTQLTLVRRDLEIHSRSAFLQGLLLMPEADAVQRLPSAAAGLGRWHAWCRERGMAPLVAALAIVKGMPDVSHCVVGVDRLEHLDAISAAWDIALPEYAAGLAVNVMEVIDPRRWKIAA
jgi:aryl-alcohol dehydrogenase-like predicted oxidoreductase